MRKILIMDPITTDFFNDMTKNYLEEIKSPDIEIEVVKIKAGPSFIKTFYDEAFALPGILKTVNEYKTKFDAIVINCFADPGIYAARELTDILVVGPAKASNDDCSHAWTQIWCHFNFQTCEIFRRVKE